LGALGALVALGALGERWFGVGRESPSDGGTSHLRCRSFRASTRVQIDSAATHDDDHLITVEERMRVITTRQ